MSIDPVSLALMAVSTVLSRKAEKKQEDRQNTINDTSTQYKLDQAAKTRASQDKFLATQQPDQRATRQAAIDNAVKSNLDTTVSDIKGFELPDTTAGTGADYAASRTAGKERTATRLGRAMDQMRATSGVARLGEQDARDYARSAYEIGANQNASNNVGAAYSDAMTKTQPDPYLTLASGLARGGGLYTALKPKPSTVAAASGGSAGLSDLLGIFSGMA